MLVEALDQRVQAFRIWDGGAAMLLDKVVITRALEGFDGDFEEGRLCRLRCGHGDAGACRDGSGIATVGPTHIASTFLCLLTGGHGVQGVEQSRYSLLGVCTCSGLSRDFRVEARTRDLR